MWWIYFDGVVRERLGGREFERGKSSVLILYPVFFLWSRRGGFLVPCEGLFLYMDIDAF